MDDTISRKCAIDALCAACGKACDKSKFVYNATQDEQVILCPEHYCLCTLPSAQPEIIRCRNCKFASGDSRICMQFGHSPIGELDFCAWAERRTDG